MSQFMIMAGAIVMAALVLLLYVYFERRGKRKRRQAAQVVERKNGKAPPEPNCWVMDAARRSMGFRYLAPRVLKEIAAGNDEGLGRQYDKDGKQVYWLWKSKEGSYTPVPVPATLACPPALLWEALQTDAEELVYDMTMEKGVLEKYGPYIAIFGIAFFALIVLVTK